MVVEFAGGLYTHSLALLADAGHMLMDVGALSLALFASWMSVHPPSSRNTYGYHRLEIFAAFINGVVLAVLALVVFYEAWQRLQHPQPVSGVALTWIALGGRIDDLVAAAVLYQPGRQNLNMKAAFYHVLSDSLGSAGAVVAGLCVVYLGFNQADSLLSMLISLLILVNAWNLIRETVNVLLEACPTHLDVGDIRTALLSLPEVATVHDLHVWSITSGKEALSAHIVVRHTDDYTPQRVTDIQHMLKGRFGLTHLTLQLEPPGFEEDEIHF
jgi:cobalt-zinc-cadmium efflux system protein